MVNCPICGNQINTDQDMCLLCDEKPENNTVHHTSKKIDALEHLIKNTETQKKLFSQNLTDLEHKSLVNSLTFG